MIGIVYKIVDNDELYDCYIGSTTRKHYKRMCQHRFEYTSNINTTNSKLVFDKVGVENCKMVILETCEVSSKKELNMKEQEWIEKTSNVNKRDAYTGLTKKEYDKKYLQEYRIKNIEKIKLQQKQYNQEHMEERVAHAKEKIECKCGSTINRANKARHECSQKHLTYLEGTP